MALTFQQFIDDPNSFHVRLVKLRPYKKLSGWSLDSGSVYKTTFARDSLNQGDPAAVRHALTDLPLAASRAAMSAGDWFYDAASSLLYVWLSGGADPAGQDVYAYFWLYFCEPCEKNYFDATNDWKGLVLETPEISRGRYSTFDRLANSFGDLGLSNVTHFFDSIWTGYFLDNIEFEMIVYGYVLDPVTQAKNWLPWADARTVMRGLAGRGRFAANEASFEVKDFLDYLSIPFPLASYGVSTWPNLDPGRDGQPVHIGYGPLVGIEAVLIDSAANKYKFNAESVTSIDNGPYDENGTALGTSSTSTANAEFTLTAPHSGRVFIDFTRDVGTGATKNRGGTIKKHILLNVLGVASANVDSTAYDTLDTDRPYVLGISIPARQPVSDIFDEINRSVLAEDNTTRDGLLTTNKIAKPTSGDPDQQTYSDYSNVIGEPVVTVEASRLARSVNVGYMRDRSRPDSAQYRFTSGAGAGNDYPLLEDAEILTALTAKADADAIAAAYKPFIEKPVAVIEIETRLKPYAQYVGQTIEYSDSPGGFGLYWKILRFQQASREGLNTVRITAAQ